MAVRAEAPTKQEVFAAVLQGMTAAAEPVFSEGAQQVEREFSVSGSDLETLLVNFLNEAIGLANINHEAYSDARIASLTGDRVEGVFLGRPTTHLETEIKAATYHGLVIHRLPSGDWTAKVLFDV
ncbi:hypothetical protein AMJ57_02435 [Parcubacteria bacterium SG8_24]|nr:MAG: hypothetical protein AMJ57_02435 [Parcubacteria bacterium SG8_24]